MASSPRYRERETNPTSHSSSSCTTSSNKPPTTPRPFTRSDPSNPFPTTFVQADTSSFKQVVQMLTGSSETGTTDTTHKTHNAIPPVKSVSMKPNSGFRLYERRNSLKNFKISPLNPGFMGSISPRSSTFSPRKPEILSPSILDFPSLLLSPVTPLIVDPFDRTGSANNSPSSIVRVDVDKNAEEKAIRDKGFFLHRSPATTPRDSEPRLLPLFPLTSPRAASGSSSSSSA